MFFSRKKEPAKPQPVGGLVFFSSLFFLTLIALINASYLLVHLHSLAGRHLLIFILGFLPGFVFASRFITGRVAVFIHELKHQILAKLAGNRIKGMIYRRTHGHVEYEYTQDTAAYNAFISLAPYWLPLFLIVTWPLTMLFLPEQHTVAVGLVGLAYGFDCSFNVRDISPYQSDFSLIRGGFRVGLCYVLAMNAAILTFLLTWVLGSFAGMQALALYWWHAAFMVVTHFRGH